MDDARRRPRIAIEVEPSARPETTYHVIRSERPPAPARRNDAPVEDRRRYARRRLALVVHLRFPTLDAAIESETVDLSRSGVFLQSAEIRPTGTAVRITFTVEGRQLVVHGVIVRVVLPPAQPTGMGIAFDRPVADDSGLFEQLLQEKWARATSGRELNARRPR